VPKNTLTGATEIQSAEYFKFNISILTNTTEATSITTGKHLNFNASNANFQYDAGIFPHLFFFKPVTYAF